MTGNGTDQQDRLVLRSRLSDIAQLPGWIEALASRHAISGKLQFAIDLCLEEVLSNIIRHGYAGAENHSIIVRFAMPRGGYFEFVVEDEAPRFNPLNVPELPVLDPREGTRIGGQGIRLLRGFADALEYEPTPAGNRLRMGFFAVAPAVPTK